MAGTSHMYNSSLVMEQILNEKLLVKVTMITFLHTFTYFHKMYSYIHISYHSYMMYMVYMYMSYDIIHI